MSASALAVAMVLAAGPASRAAARPMAEEKQVQGVMANLAADHPRLGFGPTAERGARTVEQVRRTYREHAPFRELYQPVLNRPDDRCDPSTLAGKWIVTASDTAAERAIQALGRERLKTTAESGYYCDVWRAALAYDWLFDHPAMTDAVRDHVEGEIGRVIEAELAALDSDGPAMWHGRTQYANDTVVAALALSRHPRRAEYLRRSLAHFLVAIRALAMVEAWPEGPSYWICNRALQYPLAADCVRTALGVEELGGTSILEAIRATGYWQLHQMQPDRQFVPYGDAFGGSGLATWQPWTESIDYYATYTRDPGLIAYAEYARQTSMRQAYRRFGWALGLIYDPTLPTPADYDRATPLVYIQKHVPTARLFGRTTSGIAFFRSSWTDPDATFVSFKAGDLLAHHGHYDQGQFTLFKRSHLALISGAYRVYTSSHRLGYFIQTVGVNSLLVLAPGEYSNYLRDHQYSVDALSGGQRVVMATGSDIVSPEAWKADQSDGQHFEAAGIIAHQSIPGDYDYIAADLTAAYNSTRWAEPGNKAKVSAVVRHLVFLHRQDAVVVFDRVVATDPAFCKRWLLHHRTKPATKDETVIQGDAENGILETRDRRLVTTVGPGKLVHDVVLPADARVYKLGGVDYAFYAQTDGDGSRWAGRNLAFEGNRQPTAADGLWRTEVEPAKPAEADVFLNVLWPRKGDADEAPPVPKTAASIGVNIPLVLGDETLVFCRHADGREPKFSFQVAPGTKRVLFFGAIPNGTYRVVVDKEKIPLTASGEGVLVWFPPAGFAEYVTIQQ